MGKISLNSINEFVGLIYERDELLDHLAKWEGSFQKGERKEALEELDKASPHFRRLAEFSARLPEN